MALNTTINEMKQLLEQITHDLDKAVNGNKAASQRVRTGTIDLEKVAKVYRKESVAAEKAEKEKQAPKRAGTAKAGRPAAAPAKGAKAAAPAKGRR